MAKVNIVDAQQTLETKLTHLKITKGKTENIIVSNNYERIQRHSEALKTVVNAADSCKRIVEELKINEGEDIQEITDWCAKVEETIAEADNDLARLRKWINQTKEDDDAKSRKEQLDFEKELYETKLHYQTELGAAKSKQQSESSAHASKSSETKQQGSQGAFAKLPKLVITKFDGTYQDWTRFWGQFQEAVDKANIPCVSKFSYLMELVALKVRKSIDGLPYTAEGYNRAKSILSTKYGKESEIVKAYTRDILELPTISGKQANKIHEFYERLRYNVQSLETLGKLNQVNGNVALTLDKLPGIKGDLVRTDDGWEEWDFVKLCEALRMWTRRNPPDASPPDKSRERTRDRSDKLYNSRQNDIPKPRVCAYCEQSDHKSSDCPRVSTPDERKGILAKKRLCFNCTGPKHRAAECNSKMSCQLCGKKHHTSICGEHKGPENKILTAAFDAEGIFPTVIIQVEGVTCRALIDSGAGSSYASAKLLDMLNKRPIETRVRRVEMLMSSRLTKLEVYETTIQSITGEYKMAVHLTKINNGELLSLDNPRYQQLIGRYSHLEGVCVDDNDSKAKLPVHVVLGAGEYARIKTGTKPRIGRDGEPVAELTKLGWVILSPGQEIDSSRVLMAQTTQVDYEELCRLDVLGLADGPQHDQREVYSEFREQLKRHVDGWYETGLPWRGNHPPLPSNERGSLQRLNNLTRKLERTGKTAEYDSIIAEQKEQGVVEVADKPAEGVEFYIPHKPVVRENAESTKTRIVYDASARAHSNAPSLNECLHTGPSLQNKLWDVLVRQRAHAVAVTGDMKRAFLQVRVKESDRDALRFHWKSGEHSNVETLRFTRALFGLAPSPFLLGAVIECHLESWKSRAPEAVAELRDNLYVDDLLTGAATVEEAKALKDKAIEIFEDATFTLHKWHSNASELDESQVPPEDTKDDTYAKQQLGKPADVDSSLLGLGWDKCKDELRVSFPSERAESTKRGVLRKLAKVYDPLGLVSPLTLEGKLIYRDVCCEKTAWDAELTETLRLRWENWQQRLPENVTVPRSLVQFRERIEEIELHSYGDASSQGVGACVYAVVRQNSGVTQRLVAAKARLAKQGVTIPRLELISAHMATNLVMNVKAALTGFPVTAVYGWLDSTVALYWILGSGEFKQFVQNRVRKIQAHPEIIWRHVGTTENPADLASRGGDPRQRSLWWSGPVWLCDKTSWPADVVTVASRASQAEAKVTREIFAPAVGREDGFDKLLAKWDLNKAIRIGAWALRFLHNARNLPNKRRGPLTTQEIENVHILWIKRVQSSGDFQEDRLQLNLQLNEQGVLECRGRIQGDYPIYLPDNHLYTQKLVQQKHLQTLHGGVVMTMASVRENHWIPRLRRLVKRTLRSCHGCRRFQINALAAPPPGNLPRDRTCAGYPFQVLGVDFAGPLTYRLKKKKEAKAYIVVYACSLTRAIHLELTKSLETKEFLRTLKELIARRGRPQKIYSDNGRTFVGAARWMKAVMHDESLQNFLATNHIKWQFNLSRAPWWGGQFERMVALIKNSLYKSVGGGFLKWEELKDVLLDIEVALNNRPLSYVEEDVQLPTLTPNLIIYPQCNILPEIAPHHIAEVDLRRRAKHIQQVKTVLWKRWTREYLRGLRERHNLNHGGKPFSVAIGDVVLVKSDEKNRGRWPLGIVEEVYPGRDGVVRAVKLRSGKNHLERAVQHLFPLELNCDRATKAPKGLNPTVAEFRPSRSAALKAREEIRRMIQNEKNEET